MILDRLFNPSKYQGEEKNKKTKIKLPNFFNGIRKGVKKLMENVKIFTKEEDEVILSYLDKQIMRTEKMIPELRTQIEKSPDDEHSKKKIQNLFYLRDELLSMKRRINFKE